MNIFGRNSNESDIIDLGVETFEILKFMKQLINKFHLPVVGIEPPWFVVVR